MGHYLGRWLRAFYRLLWRVEVGVGPSERRPSSRVSARAGRPKHGCGPSGIAGDGGAQEACPSTCTEESQSRVQAAPFGAEVDSEEVPEEIEGKRITLVGSLPNGVEVEAHGDWMEIINVLTWMHSLEEDDFTELARPAADGYEVN